MRFLFVPITVLLLSPVAPILAGKEEAKLQKEEKGTVHFKPLDDQKNVPKSYQLEANDFEYKIQLKKDYPLSGYSVYQLRYPSPINSPHVENNTVWAEYYTPKHKKQFPCVIVLDITGGDQSLSRIISSHLVQNGIGALFVQMAYYGPRRPPGSKLRLMSFDLDHTMKAVRQTVLDLRCATAWMESRPEIDSKRLGIIGTSLGGFMAALTAEMEPKLGRVAILLAGGGFVDAFWDDPRVAPYQKAYQWLGGTKEMAKQVFAPLDPITCAENLKNRKVLMLAAKQDELVPPKMAEALWKASGQQKIHWFNAGHYTSAVYLVPAMKHVLEHFGAP